MTGKYILKHIFFLCLKLFSELEENRFSVFPKGFRYWWVWGTDNEQTASVCPLNHKFAFRFIFLNPFVNYKVTFRGIVGKRDLNMHIW